MSDDLLSPEECHCLMHLVGGSSVDIGLLRHELGTTTPRVREYQTKLSDCGCLIETTGIDSILLVRSDIRVWQDYLGWALTRAGVLPTNIRIYRETASTQDIAKQAIPHRTVVLADAQTRGRGRLGRKWQASPGSAALMSIVWPNNSKGLTHDRVSMIAGVAIARAVERLAPAQRVQLKWPNDIMVSGKKLAGILIESVRGTCVIGIGINVSQSPPDEGLTTPATDLARIGCTTDRLGVIEQIIIEIDRALRMGSAPELIDEWRQRSTLGEPRIFENQGQRIHGIVLDLDADAGLIVRRDTGELVTLPAATTSVVQ